MRVIFKTSKRMGQLFLTSLFLSTVTYGQTNQLPVFKHFSDYRDIKPTKHSKPASMRAHFWAKQKYNDRPHDPTYKNNTWKLVMRRGIFLSEVEKAMSEIYGYFLGYSTDIDLVEEQGDYYAARRKFKHFKVFENLKNKDRYLIHKVDDKFYVEDYLLMDDGSLIKDNQVKHLTGLAKIAVLTRFFAESDAETFNYGLQETETEFRALQFDNEHAFTSGDMSDYPDIEKNLVEIFGDKLIQMTWYQREKQQMLNKIANTDFAIIERMIRAHITVSSLEEARWTLNKILKDPTVFPDYDRKEAKEQLDEVNAMDDSQFGVDKIVAEVKERHQKLREQLGMDAK